MKMRKLGPEWPHGQCRRLWRDVFRQFLWPPATDEGSMAILDECVELGITHIDTSNVYGMGRSETVIGDWLKKRGGEAPFTIASKVGITDNPRSAVQQRPHPYARGARGQPDPARGRSD